MNRRDAALLLARRYPGGIEALATRMGKSPHTLRKELAGANGYKWGTEDEETLIALCQAANVPDALAPITAAAVNAGALVMLLPPQGADSSSFQCLADTAREFSDFTAIVAQAEADGRVTANEMKRIEREGGELVSSMQRCIAHMRSRHDEGRPGALRSVSLGAALEDERGDKAATGRR